MVEYYPFWFAVLIAIGVVFISLAIIFGLKIAYSQDADPRYVCINKFQYPYNEACIQQEYERMCDLFYNASSWEMYTKLECMTR
jgi:hypothetical protein